MLSPLLIGTSDARSRMTRMGIARIVVGLNGVVPSVGSHVFGAPPEQMTHAARLLARIFGIRNIVLGSWALMMRDASTDERRRCLQLNMAVDIADLTVVVPAIARRELRRTAIMSTLLGTSAMLGWLQILSDR